MTQEQAITLLTDMAEIKVLLQGITGVVLFALLVAVIVAMYKFFKMFF